MNKRKNFLKSVLFAACALTVGSALAGSGTLFSSNGSGGGNFDDPATWVPNGVPSFSNGDEVTIVNGDTVLSSNTMDSAFTVNVDDGILIINNNFVVRNLNVNSNGSGSLEAFDANVYFSGNDIEPATFSNMQGFTTIGSVFVSDSTSPTLTSNAYLKFDDSFLIIDDRFQVSPDSTIELFNESSIQFNGDFGDTMSYNYNSGSSLHYTGLNSNYFPFDEWRPNNNFTAPTQSPTNVLIGEFVDVNMRTELTSYTVNSLTMLENSFLALPDNDAFLFVDGTTTILDGAVMEKIYDDQQLFTVASNMDFGATGVEYNFADDAFNKNGIPLELIVRRLGNEGPLSGTFTEESFDVEIIGNQQVPPKGGGQIGPYALEEITLPSRSFSFLNQAVIFNREEPFQFFDPLSTALTNDDGSQVNYASPTDPTDIIISQFNFSSFFINDGLINTVAELQEFSGDVSDGNIFVVKWNTASEIDNVGFNVYRGDVAGTSVRKGDQLNQNLIKSLAILRGEGSDYMIVDPIEGFAGETRYYYLEDVDVNGVKTLHGPISLSAE